MALTELPPPPDSERLHRTSKRWAIGAALLCPCHLWLVAGALSLFGAGVTASAIRENEVMLAVVLAPLSAVALWRAVASGRRATELKRTGQSCAAATTSVEVGP